MPPRDAQLPLSFARPPKRKGGLSLKSYRELVERLRADAARVAGQFKLPFKNFFSTVGEHVVAAPFKAGIRGKQAIAYLAATSAKGVLCTAHGAPRVRGAYMRRPPPRRYAIFYYVDICAGASTQRPLRNDSLSPWRLFHRDLPDFPDAARQ